MWSGRAGPRLPADALPVREMPYARNAVGRVATVRKSGQGRARTADTGLFRAVLYQLSYLTNTTF